MKQIKNENKNSISTKVTNVYEREKLYEQVWSSPVIQVAKLYGVSNVAIKKICKSMNIPTPSPGYWVKLKYGKEVHKISLPFLLNEQTKEKACNPMNNGGAKIKFDYGSICFLTHDEQESFREIVSICTTSADQLLTSYESDITEKMCFRGYVSDEQKERAIKIYKYTVAGILKMGGRINDDGSFDIRGEDIVFSLMERYNEVPHVLSEQEKIELCEYEKQIGKGHYASRPKIPTYDCIRNGKLVFEIHHYGKNDSRIGDTPKRMLEDRIPEIIYKFLKTSEERRKTHLDTLEMDLKEKEEKRLAKLRNQELIKEKEKLELLLDEVNDYDIAMKIRAYINYVQKRGSNQENTEWIVWANDKADWYDPTINKKDNILDIRDHKQELIPSKKEIPYPW